MSETPNNVVQMVRCTAPPEFAPTPSGSSGEVRDFREPFAQKKFDAVVREVLFEHLGHWVVDIHSQRLGAHFWPEHLSGLPNTDLFAVAESMRRIFNKLKIGEAQRHCCVTTCGGEQYIDVQLDKDVYDRLCVEQKSRLK